MPLPKNTIHLSLGPELQQAVEERAAETGSTVSSLIRRAVAKFLGRPKLADQVQRGRPRKVVDSDSG